MRDYDGAAVELCIRGMLAAFGEDPGREGLKGTPNRVARAWKEMLSGYDLDPTEVLKTSDGGKGFEDVGGYDGLVVVSGIPFTSICEHHLLPFNGTADVGYLPARDGALVGLSKIPRLVLAFAYRLQVQERLTTQIAEALQKATDARGVGVRIASVHTCMSCRGVKIEAPMVTQVLLGAFRSEADVRAEFISLADRGGR